jgi:hypothetical protein
VSGNFFELQTVVKLRTELIVLMRQPRPVWSCRGRTLAAQRSHAIQRWKSRNLTQTLQPDDDAAVSSSVQFYNLADADSLFELQAESLLLSAGPSLGNLGAMGFSSLCVLRFDRKNRRLF